MAGSTDVPEAVVTTLRSWGRAGINVYHRDAVILRCAIVGEPEVRDWLELHGERYYEVILLVKRFSLD